MVKMTLGCDPEFFLVKRGNYARVSAHDKIPGNKREPHKLPNGGAVQADGTAIEFNTEPATTSKEFADNIESCLNDIRKMIPSSYLFYFHPVVKYPDKTFEVIPEHAKELGCDPDYDAYTLEANPRPVPPDPNIRTGAGHLHIGWNAKQEDVYQKSYLEECAYLIKHLDIRLYPEVFRWSRDKDEDLRREVYGKKGAFRPKKYGVEYRSLSNSWLGGGRELWMNIFDSVEDQFNCLVQHKFRTHWWSKNNYHTHKYM